MPECMMLRRDGSEAEAVAVAVAAVAAAEEVGWLSLDNNNTKGIVITLGAILLRWKSS